MKYIRNASLLLLALLLTLQLASCGLIPNPLAPETTPNTSGEPSDSTPGTSSDKTPETTPQYTITYDLGYGEPETVTYTPDGPDVVPSERVREGYEFLYYTVDGKDGKYSGTVTSGSFGDVVFHAVWRPIEYTISYDLAGGTAENPSSYTIESEEITLADPVYEGYRFLGWQSENGTLQKSAVIPAGSTGDLLFRAVWSATDYTFRTESNPAGAPITANIDSEMLAVGSTIRLTAPVFYGDNRFAGWKRGEVTVSETAVYLFSMPAADTVVTAVYEPIEIIRYNASSDGDLVLPTDGFVPSYLLGADAEAVEDYTVTETGVRVHRAFLSNLASDDYRFCAVQLSEEHTVVRSQEWTVRIAGTSAGTDPEPIGELPEEAKSYQATTFTYQGQTYDCVVTTEEELKIAAEYFLLVDGVLRMQEDPDPEKEWTFPVWATGSLASGLFDGDALSEMWDRITASISQPMSPSAAIGIKGNKDGAVITLKATYRLGLNEVVSTQEKTSGPDLQGLLSATGRADEFDSFPIDRLTKTAQIRTVYELETLPFGYRPVFAESTGTAAEVYRTARTILREIIDDEMDDYAKVTAIYAWLGLNVTYDDVAFGAADSSKYSAFTVKGAMCDRVAVCDGFSSAFRLLCQIEGIRAEEVSGVNEWGNVGTGHAWNKVEIGGAIFAVDSTWARHTVDDQIYVTLQYLFLDEAGLIDSRHFENGWDGTISSRTPADASIDLYRANTVVSNDGFVVSSELDLIPIIHALQANGITIAEIRVEGNFPLYSTIEYEIYRSEDSPYATILMK